MNARSVTRVVIAFALSILTVLCVQRHFDVTQSSTAQSVGPVGLQRVAVTGGILSGSGTVANPLTATITTDSTITGTGSSGSGLTITASLASVNFGLFGTGEDGTRTFDGSSVVLGMTPVANVYTLDHDIFCHSCTIDSGVTVRGPYRIYDDGTLTLNGKITRNGADGSGITAGAAEAAGSLPATKGGGGGGSTAGGAATAGTGAGSTPRDCTAGAIAAGATGGTCQGGGGGTGASGAGAAGGTTTLAAANQGDIRVPIQAQFGKLGNASDYTISSGGGGGRGDAANTKAGGGGGAGGGYIYGAVHQFAGTGSYEAKGGAGGAGGAGGNAGGGGGGGGGRIQLVIGTGSCPTMTNTGGAAGTASGTGTNGGSGGAGPTPSCAKAGL